MRIVVQRSGGYAGVAETLWDLDTSNMDAAAAAELENLAAAAETAAQLTGGDPHPVGADFLKYQVTLWDRGQTRTWSIIDDASARVEPLCRLLNGLAANSRP